MHLDKMKIKHTEPSAKQSAYIGVDEAGPFKSDSYMY